MAGRGRPRSQSVRFSVAVWCSCPQPQSAPVKKTHRLRQPIARRLPSLFVVASASSALCPSRRVENDSSNIVFHVLTTSPRLPDSDRPKNEFVLCDSFIVAVANHGPRSRNMCASFSRFSPVWNRRRLEESCGSPVKAQASAGVDVPTALFFCSVDQGVQHVCKFLCECLAMCLSGNRP